MTKKLLYKYFEGECSPEERREVETYLKGEDLSILHAYMDEVDRNTKESDIPQEKSEQLLHSIQGKIETEAAIKHILRGVESDYTTAPEAGFASRGFMQRLPIRIAASIAIIFAIAASSHLIWRHQKENRHAGQLAKVWTTIDNTSLNVKEVKMPDGTMIWLNANSSIAYSKDEYNKTSREIKISGEAYFDVSHNPEKPFVVRSGKISTTVLGTAFNVEAYKNEKDIRVILVRGKVRVQTPGQQEVLAPGQMLSYSVNNRKISLREVETKEVNSWISGRLVFNDVPLHEAFRRIEQLYNIDISYSSEPGVEEKRLTGVFDRKSAEDVLSKILFVYGLEYQKKGGRYLIN
ncbi:FecR family protein [Desertivirga xinjiangensis]|uniref:FecR family protein n=1 Tax=Desertivirga xinjiangensis TaxID=539206 RepID=UPI00210C843C|nr:FecR domain-containing protein [Pedobacter xinjiangensis]